MCCQGWKREWIKVKEGERERENYECLVFTEYLYTVLLFLSFLFGSHPCKEDEYLNMLFIRLITVLFGGDTEVIILVLYSPVNYIHGKTYLFRTSF